MPKPNTSIAFVPASGKDIQLKPLLLPLATLVIYFMIVPIFILDLSISLFQTIYFTTFGIPKMKKHDYIVMERWDLTKLNFLQKINCVYCKYANGILAFAKAVGNQTEIYSCAIKHRHALKGHEYEKGYYQEKRFEK